MASTAESMLPKAVISTTGVSGRIRLRAPTISIPLFPGIRMSLRIASKSNFAASLRASSAEAESRTSYPCSRNSDASICRIAASSSTTNSVRVPVMVLLR